MADGGLGTPPWISTCVNPPILVDFFFLIFFNETRAIQLTLSTDTVSNAPKTLLKYIFYYHTMKKRNAR